MKHYYLQSDPEADDTETYPRVIKAVREKKKAVPGKTKAKTEETKADQ
jgi:hypothetical protein